MVVFLALHPTESISLNSLEHLAMLLTSRLAINCKVRNFLHKAIGIKNFTKPFLNFIDDTYDLIPKFQIGLIFLLRQGLLEPEFYGDLVYKLKKIVGSNYVSAHFIKNNFPLYKDWL